MKLKEANELLQQLDIFDREKAEKMIVIVRASGQWLKNTITEKQEEYREMEHQTGRKPIF